MCTEFEKARAESAKRFEVAGRRYGLADMLEANACDTDLCEWLATAEVGDRHPDGETCTRVADMAAPASAADVALASGFAGPAVELADTLTTIRAANPASRWRYSRADIERMTAQEIQLRTSQLEGY